MDIKYRSNQYVNEVLIVDGGTTVEIDVAKFNRKTCSTSVEPSEAECFMGIASDMCDDVDEACFSNRMIQEYFEPVLDEYLENKVYELQGKLTDAEFDKVCLLLGV